MLQILLYSKEVSKYSKDNYCPSLKISELQYLNKITENNHSHLQRYSHFSFMTNDTFTRWRTSRNVRVLRFNWCCYHSYSAYLIPHLCTNKIQDFIDNSIQLLKHLSSCIYPTKQIYMTENIFLISIPSWCKKLRGVISVTDITTGLFTTNFSLQRSLICFMKFSLWIQMYWTLLLTAICLVCFIVHQYI